ncbi:MAG: tetratricopeptide repeat protein [Bacteroidales bacterium]|nr:tetratricopeptide repeat protein [Bacteroidales bacterium]MBN2748978.1 tetratricopeptide repeat protein [Bacteroidales bacterium]
MQQLLLILALFLFPFANTFAQDAAIPQKLQTEISADIAQGEEFKASGDYNQAAYFYNKAATVYWVNGAPNKAIEWFGKALEMYQKIGNKNAMHSVHNSIGMIHVDEEDYPKALVNFNKCLELSRALGRKPDIISAQLNIAGVYTETGKHSDAAKILEEANALAREINDVKLIRNSYSLLSEVYEKLGDSEKSAEYFSLYTAFSRKIQRDEMRKAEAKAQEVVETAKSKVLEVQAEKQATEQELMLKQQTLRQTEATLQEVEQISQEQQMQIDLLNKEKELQEVVIENQRLIRNIFIFIILAVAAFAFLVLYSYSQKKKANAILHKQNVEIALQRDTITLKSNQLEEAFKEIEKKNRNITSSITYAQRIQQALLPPEDSLSSLLPESFIYLEPRDIVSGDFYWFTGFASTSKGARKNFIVPSGLSGDESGVFLSAVDCTGHGVPGAFMSMIGFNLLETITRNGAVKPNDILDELHRSIRFMLKQYNTDNRDGMDMALCAIRNKGQLVEFAGARNPLYYITNGELFQVKSDAVPIGGLQKESRREFTLHTIEVTAPTCFYIFSDGYIDQFGGKYSQKFSSKRFRELLLEIHHLPMARQKEILVERRKEWMGSEDWPIDDVLVIGFKLGDKLLDF